MKTYFWLTIAGVLLLAAGFTLVSTDSVLAQETPVVEDPPFLADFYNAWVNSPHADAEAEAFMHWDEEGEIPVECATCHSTTGYIDFLGGDGSAPGVDVPAVTGGVITCDACHNSAAASLTSVTFPSGLSVATEGNSARCMVCHQGRESTVSVNAAIEETGMAADMNAPVADASFINIHYYAAAATLYGTEAKGGYEYEGMAYEVRNEHVEGMDSCADCHNPHTTELQISACATCHEDVETVEDLRDIRMQGSLVDFDGDGDDFEGLYYEVQGMQELLFEAIQTYAVEVAGTPIAYDSHAYPYFFIDTDEDGEASAEEAIFPNAYNAWTGNLLTAAYNYQTSIKDPGSYAHNGVYTIQLLHDSAALINSQLAEPIEDIAFTSRNAHGHFDSTSEAFRHWDADGAVPGTCARCHSAEGLPTYLANNANIAVPVSSSLQCSTCHDSLVDFTTYEVNQVTFPSGARVSFGEGVEDNLCLTCHQGRESTVSVDRAITSSGVGDDEVSDALAFRNVHYFAAGATLFGTEVKGAYEFADQEYNGRNIHVPGEVETCTDCHDAHRQELDLETCQDCHDVETVEDVRMIRQGDSDEEIVAVDYDGDGDAEEPMRDEILSFQDALFAALQTYATDVVGTSIAYNSHAYPYWFTDTNSNGVVDEDEMTDNAYATWTPNLLRAAYNYQYMQKDPGVYAHNPHYALQVMYDSILAVGGSVDGFTRPEVDVTAAE